MERLARADLMSLEEYSHFRERFRREVMAHKDDRRLHLGPNLTLYFEDRLTIQYQVQEMLRIERIFEAAGIQDELDTYNPLIPDGANLKATMMIEFDDEAVRRAALAKFGRIEDRVWIKTGQSERSFATPDEDLERRDPNRTAAVHFLRFDLDNALCSAFKSAAKIAMGVDHERYQYSVEELPAALAGSLVQDLD
ncbi:MAG: DUF3501 family protein [Gammaproteobacteria bacterium]